MKKKLTQKESAELFKVFSEEIRLKLIQSLFEKEKCVSDLVRDTGFSQSLTSHHLKILKVAGLVNSWRDKHKIYYSLCPDIIKNITESQRGTLDLGCCEITFKG